MPPFVAGAEPVLVPGNLLNELVKRGLDGCSWARSLFLCRQVTGWQAQIKGDMDALARRILFDGGFQMNQFRAEDLKALLDLLDLVADHFFDVGSLVNLVTDVEVQ